MPAQPEAIGPATLALAQTIGAFNVFLPKFSDIRRATPNIDRETTLDVRMGEVAALALSVGVGVIASALTGSPIPAFVALVMGGIMVCLYEATLRSNPNAL